MAFEPVAPDSAPAAPGRCALALAAVLLASAACGPAEATANDAGPTGCADASVQFTLWANLGPIPLIYEFAVADLDGDGRPELIVAQSGATLAIVSPPAQDGGTFTVLQDLASGYHPTGVAVADLDGDGRAELVSANGDGTLGLSRGGSPGLSFTGPTLVPDAGINGLVGVAVADLDGDGRPDLVTGGNYGTGLRTFINQGGLRFAPGAEFDAGGPIGQATSGDLDGDGRDDVAFTRYFYGVVILTAVADGGAPRFTSHPQATLANLDGVSLSDLDGDGRLDILQAAERELGVYRNLGGGSFRPEVLFDGGVHFTSVAGGDVDRDGRVDLVAVDLASDTATVFLTRGGSWREALQFGADAGLGRPTHVALADFDGDGWLDFAVSSYGTSRLHVFRNATCAAASGGGPALARWFGVGCAAAPWGALWAPLLLLALRRDVWRKRRASRHGTSKG